MNMLHGFYHEARSVAPPRNAPPGGSAAANASLPAEPYGFCVTRQSHVTSLETVAKATTTSPFVVAASAALFALT